MSKLRVRAVPAPKKKSRVYRKLPPHMRSRAVNYGTLNCSERRIVQQRPLDARQLFSLKKCTLRSFLKRNGCRQKLLFKERKEALVSIVKKVVERLDSERVATRLSTNGVSSPDQIKRRCSCPVSLYRLMKDRPFVLPGELARELQQALNVSHRGLAEKLRQRMKPHSRCRSKNLEMLRDCLEREHVAGSEFLSNQMKLNRRKKIECFVCLRRELPCMLRPCWHVVCRTCADQLTACPLCRTPISSLFTAAEGAIHLPQPSINSTTE